MLKVAKFGGSSMADAGQYAKVKAIIDSDEARTVVVVSAAGKRNKDDHKITDLLYLCYAHLQYGVDCMGVFDMIADRYREICRALGLGVDIERELDAVRNELKSGVSQDWLVSRGEYFSALLLADYLGFDFLDSSQWLKFKFDGTIDRDASYEALSELAADRRVVIPGFYGVMPDGRIRVMTRGGSDITGALAAAALDADVYENWTDVSGILMADPRIVKDPDTIGRITYSELRELSYMGAQVLHEASIFPVRDKHIPLNIRNTNAPGDPGTLIMESFDEELPSEKGRLLTGIAGRRDFTIVTVAKSGLSSSVGTLRQILEIFEKHDVCVEYTPSGIDSVSLVVSTAKTTGCIYSIVGEIEKTIQPDSIDLTDGISVVAAVGRKMAYQPGSSGALFAALGQNGINIRMITQGPEELNIIVGVNNADFEKTVRVIYDSFVK
jgi:aspartate kinase